jgi:hypothetical protein
MNLVRTFTFLALAAVTGCAPSWTTYRAPRAGWSATLPGAVVGPMREAEVPTDAGPVLLSMVTTRHDGPGRPDGLFLAMSVQFRHPAARTMPPKVAATIVRGLTEALAASPLVARVDAAPSGQDLHVRLRLGGELFVRVQMTDWRVVMLLTGDRAWSAGAALARRRAALAPFFSSLQLLPPPPAAPAAGSPRVDAVAAAAVNQALRVIARL